MRVPFEALKRAAKDRKSLLDEAQEALAASSGTAESLDALLEKLHSLKRKLAEVSRAEREEAGRCRHRLEHLRVLAEPRGDMIAWNKQRLDRLLVDFCHRCERHAAHLRAWHVGMLDALAEAAHGSGQPALLASPAMGTGLFGSASWACRLCCLMQPQVTLS